MKAKTSKTKKHAPVRNRAKTRRSAPEAGNKKSSSAAPIRLRKILVPVDFSERSRKALRYALTVARQFKANLLLLYVVRTPAITAEAEVAALPLLETQMIESGKRELADWAKKETVADLKVATLVRAGSPYHEIVETAKTERIDLIILSTHGHTGLKHVLLGSTAESVVRHAPCPVLVVREHERDFVAA